jgi:O-antigen/teichoic acid export membrane protein
VTDFPNETLPTEAPSALGVRIAKDIAAVGTGTALASVFGTIVIFVIPRLVSVEDFGYWRVFLLYSGYAGFLHLGLIEGALLSWAGKPLPVIRPKLRPSLKFIFIQQVALLAIGTLFCLTFVRSEYWLVSIAVLVFAALQNITTLLLYALQATREFGTVGIAVSIPSGGFLVLAVVCHFVKIANYRMLIVSYLLGWTFLLLFLWNRLQPLKSTAVVAARSIGKQFIISGWPIMLANLAYGVVQSADKIVVNATASIYGFAQYSLAASVMAVPIAAIAAVSRVFFPHIAASDPHHHQKTYGRCAKFSFLCWSLTVPYYLVLARVVPTMLPKYVEGLPYAKVLLCGTVFLGSIQILQLSFSNIYGRQRQFLLCASVAVIGSLLLALLAATQLHSLTAVAASQVASVLIWWQINEWNLRDISGQTWRDWAQLLFLFGWSVLSLWATLEIVSGVFLRVILYYSFTSVFVMWIGAREATSCWRMVFAAGQRWRSRIQLDQSDSGSDTIVVRCCLTLLKRVNSIDRTSS